MIKLGCHCLAHTNAVENASMSSRQVSYHLDNSVIPNFKVGYTACLDGQGLKIIETNMESLLTNKLFRVILESEFKVLLHLLVDGVAVDRQLNVDSSQIPHQVTSACTHYKDASFVSFADAEEFEKKLDRDDTDGKGVHLAKEVEAWCLGLNYQKLTFLFPVVLIPTFKKDRTLG